MNEMEEESVANFEELVANLLHKTSAVTLKAMKDVELHVSSGLHIPELLQSAELLVQSMQRETNGRLAYVGATPVHLINFLLCRCEEERVNLKKAAICTLQALFLRLRDPDIVEACVNKLAKKCRDVSVAVRKQAALTLTRFLQGTPHFEQIHEAWLHSVMYQIVDREPSVQTHCAKLVSEVFIEPIMKNTEGNAAICWRMLALVEEEADLRRLLLRSLIFLSKERLLPPRLITLVLNRCSANPEQAYPCWMLLSELSTFLDVSPNEAVSFWSDYLSLIHPNRLIGYMADLISNQTKNLSFQQRRFLKENVSGALRRFKIHPTYISSVYHMFARIVNGVDPDAPGHAELRKFNQQWFGQCLQELDSLIYANALPETDEDDANSSSQGSAAELSGTQNENCEKIIRLITSVGECLQYTPALINKQIFKLLQVIIASDVLKRVYQTHNEKADRCENLLASPPSLNTSFQTELPVCGPGGSQSNAASEAGGVVNDGLHNQPNHFHMRIKKRIFRGELMSREVRASSVLTIGKLCLLDEQLAKKCIPVFVRQLRENQDHFVRNNIVVVICDLCIRYTSQVDRYSSILASCLWDSSILIRRQTLLLLTNLIKEQYLKWEGPIIYRFVTTLLDAEQCIQEYSNFCLTDILLPQFRERMFFHHFLECMFNFNGVRHASWIFKDSDVSELNEEAEKRCSLEGRESFNSRMRLYKYMLNTFEDQQRVYILEKIGLEIFVPIVEEGMKLTDGKVRNLLFDAFKVMGTEEIKLKMQLGKMDVDYEGDDEDPPELVKTAAKKLIATTFRKSIAETVMPHLFLLKAFLSEKRSPLVKNCYSVILDLCREHEEQLDDFLASDPQLRAEIKCDMKRLDNINKRR